MLKTKEERRGEASDQTKQERGGETEASSHRRSTIAVLGLALALRVFVVWNVMENVMVPIEDVEVPFGKTKLH